ncbi:MAG: D-Ala-D-Ala carboxypeptidase family metallohydrolase [Candidatus Paceibacterota bacterium]|jgi:uncharacterized protein YcbK (DUF882 family)
MKHFALDEFKCRCCGQVNMDEDFLSMLDDARTIAGKPFVISSGYRCPRHNAAVGSTSQNHTSGRAADIIVAYGPTRIKVLNGLIMAGFKRIGIGRQFIHVDNMDKIESCWLY